MSGEDCIAKENIMPTALIIGASRGIGGEFARQLVADGWQVHATARSDDACATLRHHGVNAIKLDVTRAESIATLAWQLDGVELDLAVYVAGVYGPSHGAKTAPTAAEFDRVMHTNVLGAMQLIPSVAPLVEAVRGKFIFLSSGMGSIGEASSSISWIYRASKAALNMAVKTAAFDYPQAVLLTMDPGWVKTDMGGPDATITVTESVAGMRRVIDGLTHHDSGSYVNYRGEQLAW